MGRASVSKADDFFNDGVQLVVQKRKQQISSCESNNWISSSSSLFSFCIYMNTQMYFTFFY